jgi:hypothetical protein
MSPNGDSQIADGCPWAAPGALLSLSVRDTGMEVHFGSQ